MFDIRTHYLYPHTSIINIPKLSTQQTTKITARTEAEIFTSIEFFSRYIYSVY